MEKTFKEKTNPTKHLLKPANNNNNNSTQQRQQQQRLQTGVPIELLFVRKEVSVHLCVPNVLIYNSLTALFSQANKAVSMGEELSQEATGLVGEAQQQGMEAVGQAQQAGMGALNQARQTGQGLVQQGQQTLSKWQKLVTITL